MIRVGVDRTNGSTNQLSLKVYDKRKDFPFKVVRYPNLDSEIPNNLPYGVFIGLLHRFRRISTETKSFLKEATELAKTLIAQGAKRNRLINCFNAFLHKTKLSKKSFVQQGKLFKVDLQDALIEIEVSSKASQTFSIPSYFSPPCSHVSNLFGHSPHHHVTLPHTEKQDSSPPCSSPSSPSCPSSPSFSSYSSSSSSSSPFSPFSPSSPSSQSPSSISTYSSSSLQRKKAISFLNKITPRPLLRQEALSFLNNLSESFLRKNQSKQGTPCSSPSVSRQKALTFLNNITQRPYSRQKALVFLDNIKKQFFRNNQTSFSSSSRRRNIRSRSSVFGRRKGRRRRENLFKKSSFISSKKLSKSLTSNTILIAKHHRFQVHDVIGDGNCLFRCFSNLKHEKLRTDLAFFLSKHCNKNWLRELYSFLDLSKVPLETHAKKIKKSGTYASFFDAFVCGLLGGWNITMVTAGNDLVNLRKTVSATNRWPKLFDLDLQPKFIGFVNATKINSEKGLNHFVNLTPLRSSF